MYIFINLCFVLLPGQLPPSHVLSSRFPAHFFPWSPGVCVIVRVRPCRHEELHVAHDVQGDNRQSSGRQNIVFFTHHFIVSRYYQYTLGCCNPWRHRESHYILNHRHFCSESPIGHVRSHTSFGTNSMASKRTAHSQLSLY